MKKLIVTSKRYLEKLKQLNADSIDVQLDLSTKGAAIQFKLPLNINDIPEPTRVGRRADDKAPFYTSDLAKLLGYYHRSSIPHLTHNKIAYGDVFPIVTDATTPIGHSNLLDFDNLKVSVEPGLYQTPVALRKHNEAAVSFFKELGRIKMDQETGEFENNVTLRISSVKPPNSMIAKQARYFDQVGTNLTLDWASGEFSSRHDTIRGSMERPINRTLPELEDSLLANTLGVAVIFYTRDLHPILRVRSDRLAAIQTEGIHCTVSGVFEVPANKPTGTFGQEYFLPGVHHVLRETGLEPAEYRLFPVCLAREFARGGKPQLFYAGIVKLNKDELLERARTAIEGNEYVLKHPLHELVEGDDVSVHWDKFTYEGWAAFHFCSTFIVSNENMLRSLDL